MSTDFFYNLRTCFQSSDLDLGRNELNVHVKDVYEVCIMAHLALWHIYFDVYRNVISTAGHLNSIKVTFQHVSGHTCN